jgi:hypothetical protein
MQQKALTDVLISLDDNVKPLSPKLSDYPAANSNYKYTLNIIK